MGCPPWSVVPPERDVLLWNEDLSPERHHHLSPLVASAGLDTYHTSVALSRLVDIEHKGTTAEVSLYLHRGKGNPINA